MNSSESPITQLRYRPSNLRSLTVLISLTIALLLTVILALSQGSIALSFAELWQALLRQGDSIQQTIIWDLRIPRIVAGLLVGASLGMSGAMLQGMLRNSLADSFVLGISSGAGLVALALITIFSILAVVPIGAWCGALVAAAAVYALGYQGGRIVK